MNMETIIAVAETISHLKTDADYYRTLYENEQRENAKLRERIAQLLGKYAEMEVASNAENALETAG